MNNLDTAPLRQLFDHLGIEPLFIMPSLAAWQIQQHDPEERLPAALRGSLGSLHDLAVTSRNYLQIGLFEFFAGLEFMQGGRSVVAIQYFETARRQWLFIDHLPLISLAHLGMGMAHHAAGEFRQAGAAYFKVRQCLQQAEMEPHRLEKIEAERSLQSFWNDLERYLMSAITSLQRDFDSTQQDRLKSDFGTVPDETPVGAGQKMASSLSLQMRPVRTITAAEVNELIGRTANGIERLNDALCPPVEGVGQHSLKVTRISYAAQDELTLELSDVSPHAIAFCRWLMKTIPAETVSTGTYDDPTAGDVADPPDGSQAEEDEPSLVWFRLQVQSGHVGRLLEAYVKSVAGRQPESDEIAQLVKVVEHLAELRTNCQLTLS